MLGGTWCSENGKSCEHWDVLNDSELKGVFYKSESSGVRIQEYLALRKAGRNWVYEATVPGKHKGATIPFAAVPSDSSLAFENPENDFPRRIEYIFRGENEIQIHLTGSTEKPVSWSMFRQEALTPGEDSAANPLYDAALAAELGADEYGMKSYYFVILRTGPADTQDKALVSSSFAGHLDNIRRLVEEGMLVVAGPFGKNEFTYRGLFIFQDVGSEEALLELLQTDPAIANGFLEPIVFSWYGDGPGKVPSFRRPYLESAALRRHQIVG